MAAVQNHFGVQKTGDGFQIVRGPELGAYMGRDQVLNLVYHLIREAGITQEDVRELAKADVESAEKAPAPVRE